jgi:acyl-CoA thioesterase FadM
MDFGRFDLLMRAGIFRTLWRRGWTPIVVAETIQFRRSLQWGQRFRLHTQLVGWTDKDFFIQQTFRRQGSIYAQGVIKGRFVQRDRGTVPVAELLALAGQPDAVSPPLPDWIRQWNASLDAARAAIRAAEGASSSV